eukprot:1157775-Pelagomonas_calceolata.AAC.6
MSGLLNKKTDYVHHGLYLQTGFPSISELRGKIIPVVLGSEAYVQRVSTTGSMFISRSICKQLHVILSMLEDASRMMNLVEPLQE